MPPLRGLGENERERYPLFHGLAPVAKICRPLRGLREIERGGV